MCKNQTRRTVDKSERCTGWRLAESMTRQRLVKGLTGQGSQEVDRDAWRAVTPSSGDLKDKPQHPCPTAPFQPYVIWALKSCLQNLPAQATVG